ncbi:MAG TPA: right-handed parallel beta-helix repeat-containing protein [Victivallis vadensis]|nr:right-handed parallel beta-helix repeat-containing protein [Victivallis vadensis]
MKIKLSLAGLVYVLCAGAAIAAVPIAQFGAKGDGVTDDSAAIQTAFDSGKDLVFDRKIYVLTKPLTLKGAENVRIDFGNALLVKRNREEFTVKVVDSSGIQLTGGRFIISAEASNRPEVPEKYAKSIDAHTFLVLRCRDLSIRRARISGSGQMGICAMLSIGLTFADNVIENCFRDGIYSHYCADVRYLYNRLAHIKDDALSFHDYGLPNQRKWLTKAGYPQSGSWIVSGNVIRNAYQGISSIGCNRVTITGNLIENTVNAGICVFNSDRIHRGGSAEVANVVIANNQIFNTGKTTRIITKEYKNGLDTCTARAAICAQAQGGNHLMPTATRRLSNVMIVNNIIRECGTEGIQGHFVDSLTISGNQVENCNSSGKSSTQNIIETIYCTDVQLKDNTITDTRTPVLHGRGWAMRESTGKAAGNLVRGSSVEVGSTSVKAPANWRDGR